MKQFSSAMRSYVLVTILYLLLTLLLPANKTAQRLYHLSAIDYHILLFIVVLPIVAIWFAAFYGYGQLRRYASTVAKTREGDSFKQLARGCKWLAWGFPVPAIISIVLSSITNSHPGFRAANVIMDTYITLIIPLVAFTILNNGSRRLINNARLQIGTSAVKIIVGLFVVLGVLYCFLTFRQLNLQNATSTNNPFYLPTWLMVVSVTVPYLYAWFAGLFAAYEIALFGRRSHGILYRKPLRILAVGIGLVIAGSITLQYVTSIEPRSLHLALDTLLLITYAVRFVAGVGYILIAIGATRLRRIEEV